METTYKFHNVKRHDAKLEVIKEDGSFTLMLDQGGVMTELVHGMTQNDLNVVIPVIQSMLWHFGYKQITPAGER